MLGDDEKRQIYNEHGLEGVEEGGGGGGGGFDMADLFGGGRRGRGGRAKVEPSVFTVKGLRGNQTCRDAFSFGS